MCRASVSDRDESVEKAAAVDRPAQNLSRDFLDVGARLRQRSGFRLALARYCHDMAGEAPIAWPIYKLFDQLHRYMASYMLIHNYYAWQRGGGPPPTLTALQKVTGTSERQTAGFVAAMKAGSFVVAETDPADRRVRWLKPAPAMVEEVGRSVRLFVRATDEIEDRRPAFSDLLGESDRLGELLQRSAAFVLENGTLIHDFPRVLHFAGRDCGYPLLTAVIGAHYAAAVSGAPKAVPLTLRSLAQRFQVSRAHVGNLLEEAAQSGWFSVGDGGRLIEVSDDLIAEFEQWACWQMAHYQSLAAASVGPADAPSV
jgi:hypothetical protein